MEKKHISQNNSSPISIRPHFGIVLEQRVWQWFNMSIGTVGYFNCGVKDENAIGLVSNLGFEPNNHIPFHPFITYRSDIIFQTDTTKQYNSISFGMKYKF